MIEVNGTMEGFHCTGNVTHIFTASSAKEKCKTLHCTVIMAKITEGKVTRGEKIEVLINNQKRMDTVCRIEKEKQEVALAQKGDDVGICLSEVDLRDFGLIFPSA